MQFGKVFVHFISYSFFNNNWEMFFSCIYGLSKKIFFLFFFRSVLNTIPPTVHPVHLFKFTFFDKSGLHLHFFQFFHVLLFFKLFNVFFLLLSPLLFFLLSFPNRFDVFEGPCMPGFLIQEFHTHFSEIL